MGMYLCGEDITTNEDFFDFQKSKISRTIIENKTIKYNYFSLSPDGGSYFRPKNFKKFKEFMIKNKLCYDHNFNKGIIEMEKNKNLYFYISY